MVGHPVAEAKPPSACQAFHQQAAAYQQHAHNSARVQPQVAAAFIQWLNNNKASQLALPTLIEVGCGTGLLTQQLPAIFPHSTITATDAAPNMVAMAQQHTASSSINFTVWDANQPLSALPTPTPSGLVSSMAMHWLDNWQHSLTHWQQHTSTIALAAMVEGSLVEWYTLCAQHNAPCKSPVFPSINAITQTFGHSWQVTQQSYTVTESHTSPWAFAKHLHIIGAATPSQHTQQSSHGFLKTLAQQHANGATPFSVTYQLAFVLAHKQPTVN